jgi:hypothetical protein
MYVYVHTYIYVYIYIYIYDLSIYNLIYLDEVWDIYIYIYMYTYIYIYMLHDDAVASVPFSMLSLEETLRSAAVVNGVLGARPTPPISKHTYVYMKSYKYMYMYTYIYLYM